MRRRERKLNQRQEAFCRAYVATGGIGRQAYAMAGYSARMPADPRDYGPVDACATKLLKLAKVEKRIQHIRRAMQRRKDVTEDSIIDELEQARQGAMNSEQHGAAVQATIAKAKLVGLMVDRKEIRRGEIENMTEAELRAYLEDSPTPNAPSTKATQ